MTVVEVRDKELIAAHCRRTPFVHVYELGDLDDFFWPHTRWFGWDADGVRQLALLYSEPEVPVLLGLAEEPVAEMEALLAALLTQLPERLYAHVTPSLVHVMRERYVIAQTHRHLKMGLTRVDHLERLAAEARLLTPADLPELETFFRHAYPGTWFAPRMLETGRYVGIRANGRLACVAGVHVYSPTWRVAALGNVATLPEARGHGLATATCAALCRILVADGIDTIALNVRADNVPAIAVYRKLGFEPVLEYVEAMLTARRA
jgi:ribosomal protein S18 acetylase RimI-like enzyme